jgi:hypothetical protein
MSESTAESKNNEKAKQAILDAVQEFREGKPITQSCAFCSEKLVVVGYPPEKPTIFDVVCPCGKSKTRLFGM